MARRDQHVVPYQGKWAVREAGNEHVSSVHRTQEEAVDVARATARNVNAELFVHGRDGRIRKRDSHGNDPYPPRG